MFSYLTYQCRAWKLLIDESAGVMSVPVCDISVMNAGDGVASILIELVVTPVDVQAFESCEIVRSPISLDDMKPPLGPLLFVADVE